MFEVLDFYKFYYSLKFCKPITYEFDKVNVNKAFH